MMIHQGTLIDDLMLIVGRVVTERRFRTPRRLVLLQGGKPNSIAGEALPPEKPQRCLICKCLLCLPDETPVGMEPICDLCITQFSEPGEVMLRDGDILRISAADAKEDKA